MKFRKRTFPAINTFSIHVANIHTNGISTTCITFKPQWLQPASHTHNSPVDVCSYDKCLIRFIRAQWLIPLLYHIVQGHKLWWKLVSPMFLSSCKRYHTAQCKCNWYHQYSSKRQRIVVIVANVSNIPSRDIAQCTFQCDNTNIPVF